LCSLIHHEIAVIAEIFTASAGPAAKKTRGMRGSGAKGCASGS
jgi:hypothetical protein